MSEGYSFTILQVERANRFALFPSFSKVSRETELFRCVIGDSQRPETHHHHDSGPLLLALRSSSQYFCDIQLKSRNTEADVNRQRQRLALQSALP